MIFQNQIFKSQKNFGTDIALLVFFAFLIIYVYLTYKISNKIFINQIDQESK